MGHFLQIFGSVEMHMGIYIAWQQDVSIYIDFVCTSCIVANQISIDDDCGRFAYLRTIKDSYVSECSLDSHLIKHRT